MVCSLLHALKNKNKNRPFLRTVFYFLFHWCSGRESNPYGHFCPQDFKSCVSTYSTTRAEKVRKCKNFFPKCVKKFI